MRALLVERRGKSHKARQTCLQEADGLIIVHELLVVLLQHENRDVVHVSSGILMNLAGDAAARTKLDGQELLDSMIEVLISCQGLDWQLAGTCAKCLWNLLSGMAAAKSGECVTAELLEDLAEVLNDLTGRPDPALITSGGGSLSSSMLGLGL